MDPHCQDKRFLISDSWKRMPTGFAGTGLAHVALLAKPHVPRSLVSGVLKARVFRTQFAHHRLRWR
jgi:hypothetical protein